MRYFPWVRFFPVGLPVLVAISLTMLGCSDSGTGVEVPALQISSSTTGSDLDDVRAVAPAVLRHRLVTNFAAEAADRTSEDLVRELVGSNAWLSG